jgi:hypothetical protein
MLHWPRVKAQEHHRKSLAQPAQTFNSAVDPTPAFKDLPGGGRPSPETDTGRDARPLASADGAQPSVDTPSHRDLKEVRRDSGSALRPLSRSLAFNCSPSWLPSSPEAKPIARGQTNLHPKKTPSIVVRLGPASSSLVRHNSACFGLFQAISGYFRLQQKKLNILPPTRPSPSPPPPCGGPISYPQLAP